MSARPEIEPPPMTPREMELRLRRLEEELAMHVNSTNNPHHTTAELSGAVPRTQYKGYVHVSLVDSIAMLVTLKSIRNTLVFLAVLFFVGAYNSDTQFRVVLTVAAVCVGCIGVLVASLTIMQSRYQRNLRHHLNDISR